MPRKRAVGGFGICFKVGATGKAVREAGSSYSVSASCLQRQSELWEFCVTLFICNTREPDYSPLLVCLHTNQPKFDHHNSPCTGQLQKGARECRKKSRCLSQNSGLKNPLQFRITREVQVGKCLSCFSFLKSFFIFFKKGGV